MALLSSFLGACRVHLEAALAPGRTVRVRVALGNEGADLDSMVSALVYAAHRSAAGEDAKGPQVMVPLINCARADFPLRTEAVELFKSLGLGPERLLFAEEADLRRLAAEDRLEVTLLDHNRLSEATAFLKGTVVRILDHHRDEGCYSGGAVQSTIVPVGSCATLVAAEGTSPRGDTGLAPVTEEGTRRVEDEGTAL